MNILLAFKAEPDAGMLAEKEWQAAAQGKSGPDISLLRSLLGADEQAAAALLLAQRKNGTPMSLTALSMGDERALHWLRYLMALGFEEAVLLETAADEEMDIIMGLDIGGDDYITKPFKLGVLVSRVNALLRRAKDFSSADTQLESNGMKVLLLQGQAFKNGKLLDLTAAEYKLLCLFMKNPNMVLTKEQILDKLWDCDGNYIDSSTLTVYMRRLRIKIEDNPSEPQMLLTVRGMGYKWNVIG